jgi:hypothetical protein
VPAVPAGCRHHSPTQRRAEERSDGERGRRQRDHGQGTGHDRAKGNEGL